MASATKRAGCCSRRELCPRQFPTVSQQLENISHDDPRQRSGCDLESNEALCVRVKIAIMPSFAWRYFH